jgi:hypothetical protein
MGFPPSKVAAQHKYVPLLVPVHCGEISVVSNALGGGGVPSPPTPIVQACVRGARERRRAVRRMVRGEEEIIMMDEWIFVLGNEWKVSERLVDVVDVGGKDEKEMR